MHDEVTTSIDASKSLRRPETRPPSFLAEFAASTITRAQQQDMLDTAEAL